MNNKIIFLDIETSPNVGLFFNCGSKQNINHNQIMEERQIMSIAWVGYDETKPHIVHWGLNHKNEKKALKVISKLINSCTAVIGQNSDHFDIPWIQGRLAYHNLPSLPDTTVLVTMDTLKIARSAFNLNCYKLDYMLKFFGINNGKMHMEWDDWFQIKVYHSKTHWAKMLKYNLKDAVDTKALFKRIAPYAKLPYRLNLLLQKGTRESCPQCGSDNKGVHEKLKLMPSGLYYVRFRCKDCGKDWRDYMNVEQRRKKSDK